MEGERRGKGRVGPTCPTSKNPLKYALNAHVDLNNAADWQSSGSRVYSHWTVETRPKPSFQISLTWQVSTVESVELKFSHLYSTG